MASRGWSRDHGRDPRAAEREYGYDPGPYEGYINETDNNKILAKLDWNINQNNSLTFRWNYLDANATTRRTPSC